MVRERVSLFHLILQIAVGCMLAIGGIWALQGGGDFAADAIRSIFKGDICKIMVIVFGVLELVVGILLILKIFIAGLSNVSKFLMLIVTIVWIVAIVLGDILGPKGILHGGASSFLAWLYALAMHVIILCGILLIK